MNKTIARFLAALVAAFLLGFCTGCSTAVGTVTPTVLQRLIDGAGLDRGFRGDAHLRETFPGAVNVDVTFTDLRHDGTRWVWGGLVWKRNGVWTSGDVSLTQRSQPAAAAPAVSPSNPPEKL
jgi:hypothetical protein